MSPFLLEKVRFSSLSHNMEQTKGKGHTISENPAWSLKPTVTRFQKVNKQLLDKGSSTWLEQNRDVQVRHTSGPDKNTK